MAEYLEKEHWGSNEDEQRNTANISSRQLNKHPPDYEIPHITAKHLHELLKEFKSYRAPGPDRLEADLFKNLPEIALEFLAEHINQWINGEPAMDQELWARIAAIFKKGDFKNSENYRPIALLNTIYKLKARVLKDIISQGIEKELQPTQYAFRKTAAPYNRYTV